MSDSRILFEDEMTIYINNVCNLSCNNCMSFSNRRFKGNFSWETHADYYIKWSEIVNFADLTLCGGEPFSNPDLLTWIIELTKLWPETSFWIDTNGTLLKNNIDLAKQIISMGWKFRIAIHDPAFIADIETALDNILEEYEVEDIESDELGFAAKEYYKDGKLVVKSGQQFTFFPDPIKEIKDGVSYFYDTDAEKTHEHCPAWNCYMIVNGLISKCIFIGVIPEAMKQFEFEQRGVDLINQYKPCSPYDDIEDIRTFLNNIGNYIPQCSLCNYENLTPPPHTPRPIQLYPMPKTKPIY